MPSDIIGLVMFLTQTALGSDFILNMSINSELKLKFRLLKNQIQFFIKFKLVQLATKYNHNFKKNPLQT